MSENGSTFLFIMKKGCEKCEQINHFGCWMGNENTRKALFKGNRSGRNKRVVFK